MLKLGGKMVFCVTILQDWIRKILNPFTVRTNKKMNSKFIEPMPQKSLLKNLVEILWKCISFGRKDMRPIIEKK